VLSTFRLDLRLCLDDSCNEGGIGPILVAARLTFDHQSHLNPATYGPASRDQHHRALPLKIKAGRVPPTPDPRHRQRQFPRQTIRHKPPTDRLMAWDCQPEHRRRGRQRVCLAPADAAPPSTEGAVQPEIREQHKSSYQLVGGPLV
jgi:hypothetical protein